VSNPPYVRGSELDSLDPEVVRYEPRAALSAGDDGLRFHREICARAKDYLEPGGRLIMEVGEGQADAVCRLAQSYGAARVSIFKDLVGIDRVVEATFA